MKYVATAVIGLLVFGIAPAWADDAALSARLEQLESETQTLRAELQWLREHPVRLPRVEASPISLRAEDVEPAQEDTYTLEQVESMMVATAKKYAWTKGDLTVVPYGYLWGNMNYFSERTAAIGRSYPTYVYSPDTHGEDVFMVDGRSTRFGVDVGGPKLWPFCCAKSGGKVEFDFQGDPSDTENRGGVLLRHAYVEVKNDDYRLLFGQTWDVISPLYPTTTMYAVYWNWGNIGYRRAQLRWERYLPYSSTELMTLQLSANHSCVSDNIATIRREPSDWPVMEGRVAWTLGPRGLGAKPVVIGFSGHIGEQGYDMVDLSADDVRRRTWSFNADFDVPITKRFGVRGEFQTGENLSTFLGGIAQGIDPATLTTIRTTGGWVETYYFWRPDLHTHAAFGIDDPVNQDLHAAHSRTYNQFYYANLLYDVTKQFCLGAEVGSLRTMYNDQRTGDAFRLELMARYAF
ncbi:MAG: hypothetical protein JW809_16880 [Pirellulales bacterium]|nr:hypothetical protein [Pirellulales bacterium]